MHTGKFTEHYELQSNLRTVQAVHILNDGTRLKCHKEFEKHAATFSWVDLRKYHLLRLQLQAETNSWQKTVIVIHENQNVEYFLNVSSNFVP